MKRLGVITELKYKEFFEYLKNINNRTEIFWNPNTCIWGEEFSLYKLTHNKEFSQELRNAFGNAIICDSLSDYKIGVIKSKVELFLGTNTPIPYVYRNKHLTVLNFSGDLQVVLNEFIQVKELIDVTAIPSNKIIQMLGSINPELNGQFPDVIYGKSINDVNIDLENKKEELKKLKGEKE